MSRPLAMTRHIGPMCVALALTSPLDGAVSESLTSRTREVDRVSLADNAVGVAAPGSISGPMTALPAKAFYVAPFGNDSWSGRLALPAPDGTDGPFATLAAARAAMAASSGNTRTTFVRGGDYYLAS